MSVTNRELDFGNVSLAHVQQDSNIVYRLSNGVIPRIAKSFNYKLDEKANVDNMGGLGRVIGPSPDLSANKDIVEAQILDDPVLTAAGWVDESGIMNPVNGGLWTPENPAPEDAVLTMMGGVPGVVGRQVSRALTAPQKEVIIAAGVRVMDGTRDLEDGQVKDFIKKFGRSPTEAEYLDRYYREPLEEGGKQVRCIKTDQQKASPILADMFSQYPELLERVMAAVREPATARVMALQMHAAGVLIQPNFDTQANQQVYAISSKRSLARTSEQAGEADKYQSPVTILREIPLIARGLLKAILASKYASNN